MALAKEAMMLAVVQLAMCTACGGAAAVPVDASRETGPGMEAAPSPVRDAEASDGGSSNAKGSDADAYAAVGDAAGDGAAGCDYSNMRKKYVVKNAAQCAAADFACSPPQVAFQDACGCGCVTQ
jgi:hypothetical protein